MLVLENFSRRLVISIYYNLPVYKDTYNLILKLFKATKNLPKEYKYTLCQESLVFSYKNRSPIEYDANNAWNQDSRHA